MGIRYRLSKKEIEENFQYTGLMYGVVPIYIGAPLEEPLVAVRNWLPECSLDIVESLFQMSAYLLTSINPDADISRFFKITGKIKNAKF